MDPFPEESSAFDADPVDSLPSAQDLIADADAIDAEAAPETEKPAEEPHEDASASTMPAVFLMGAPSDSNDAPAPLPDLVDASPLREWEEKHSAELLEKSKDEAERHKKILDAAAAEIENFTAQRTARIENMRKQNKEEEELFRENQKKLYTEGTIWQQAGKVMEMAAPAKKTVKKAEPAEGAAAAAAPAAEEPQTVLEDNKRDTARMRQMLTSLKQ